MREHVLYIHKQIYNKNFLLSSTLCPHRYDIKDTTWNGD